MTAVPHRVVVASKNPDKIREVEAVLARMEHPWEIVRGLEWPDVDETEPTLEGNAVLKAVAVSEATGLPALADDTGLEVDALDGAPGVHSARFAGPEASYEANVDRLLADMEGVGDRGARFRTAIAFVVPGSEPLVVVGVLEGAITTERRGDRGFGYDPVFAVGDFTYGEMTDGEKNEMSHRARALRALVAALENPEGRVDLEDGT
ncbi:MAG: RdgB/HAM1 family non-canonical purine NTP pyrophosphatase [Actinomycetota bacterium]|nr:RdgB/HAM1 family non-canonical purine NTP pyrophosphatase [Actinomycetota bacterium]